MSGQQPPRWLERIVERALPPGLSGQGTVGDLAEEYERRARASHLRARAWYLAQVVSIVVYRPFALTGGGVAGLHTDFAMDVRWSTRLLVKHRGFSLAVVTVLGLGLGAVAAVFSVVDGTFRNTSWWSDPDRTVSVWPERELSFGMLTLYAEEQSAYRSVGGYAELAFAVRPRNGESQSVNGVVVTPALFRELAAQPVMGRPLEEADAAIGVAPVVVIGESLWRRSFGGDPAVIGSAIDVSGGSVTVVGIQSAGGNAPGGRAELWFPLVVDPRNDDYFRAQNLTTVGVLRDGAGIEDASAELVAFTERLSRLFPMFYPPGFAIGQSSVTRADENQRRLISTPLLLLLGGTGLLLLVTALNVGNLLLGRAIGRRGELAVRAAIGAGRGRIVRQLLVEAALLTVLAGAAGVGCAALGGPWIAGLFVGEAVVASSPVTSPAVLGFVLAAAAVAWLVLGGVPIAHFLRAQRFGLRVIPASTAVQRTLVTVQAALATLLLVSATLLVATVDQLRRVPLGFEDHGLLAVELSPPQDRVETVTLARQLYDGLADRVGALPGVTAVGLTGWLPLRAQAPTTPINLRSAPVEPAQAVMAPLHMVDAGFFEAFGVRASAGRLLGAQDREFEASAVVVNETLAAMLWPDGTAVGQLIAIDPHAWNRWVPVVGVVPDIRSGDITGPIGPALYISLAESPARDLTLVVRTAGGTAALIPAVRGAVSQVDPLVPVRAVTWMRDVVRSAYSIAWVLMGLLVVLAGLATVLGALGIYAVLAHYVVARRKELSVRLALGARPAALVGSVVWSGLGLAGIGIAVGTVAAVMTSRSLKSLLFGVSALHTWAYVVPALALSIAAGLAAWIPAARAGRLPPAEVLRSE
ncbi:MAG TPA: ABC transporter permease [Longimicrobiales bacterium]|nr:ABC transporter permease [Longimicrobiales bacterium]